MKSYELHRPDGTAAGVWACGECDRVHAQTTRNRKPVSDANRQQAEQCCVPRKCGFCGRPTERNVLGDYLTVHEACIPKPPAPHPSMSNPWARLLFRRMSDISEDCYAAGWLIGNEYSLWRMLQGESSRYGACEVSPEELDELRILSEKADGWIWTGGEGSYDPQLVSFEKWKTLMSQAQAELEREHNGKPESGGA